jgi:cytochrome c oxidase cbb3-type subunit III
MRAKPLLARAAVLAALAFAAGGALADESATRGRAVFRTNCVQCHGENADGHGPLAARFNPPPANIAATTRTDDYLLQIITLGGAPLGRSNAMPEWGLELSGAEILDVVTYLRTVVDDRKKHTTLAGGNR